mgnify:CR=1 FL=1
MVLSAFGPFVAAGVRTDQIVVYGLFATVGLVLIWRARMTVAQLSVIFIQVLFAVFAMIPMVFDPALRGLGSIATMDNILVPIAVCVLTVVFTQAVGRERLLLIVARVTIFCMLVNSVVTIAQIGTNGRLTIGPWRPGEEDRKSVGDMAAELGRYTGILNQPALAGILYGLSILLAVYLFRRRSTLLVASVTVLIIGGALSISKAFLFVSLPICLLVTLGLLVRNRAPALIPLLGILTVVVIARDSILSYLETGSTWDGARRFRLALTDLDQVGGISGGRLGDQGSVSQAMQYVRETAPLLGVGPGGLGDEPMDTLWLFGMATNGLLGMALLGALFAVLLIALLRRHVTLSRLEFSIGLALWAILLAGSFGYPVFFGDRLAVPLWATIMLLLAVPPAPSRQEGAEAEPVER